MGLFGKIKDFGGGVIDKVKERGKQVIQDAKDLGKDAIDRGKQLGRDVLDEAQEIGRGIGKDAKEAWERGKQNLKERGRDLAADVVEGIPVVGDPAGAAIRGEGWGEIGWEAAEELPFVGSGIEKARQMGDKLKDRPKMGRGIPKRFKL